MKPHAVKLWVGLQVTCEMQCSGSRATAEKSGKILLMHSQRTLHVEPHFFH